jgi:hypothetical protein
MTRHLHRGRGIAGGAGRRLRTALLLALLALLPLATGCASLGIREPARTVVVSLDMSRAAAVRRAQAAFRAQGYTVKETLTSGSELETEPFRHDHEGDRYEAVFRAVVSAAGDATRVTLSGTYRRVQLAGLLRRGYEELRESNEGVEGELWARLENLRLAMRSAR